MVSPHDEIARLIFRTTRCMWVSLARADAKPATERSRTDRDHRSRESATSSLESYLGVASSCIRQAVVHGSIASPMNIITPS